MSLFGLKVATKKEIQDGCRGEASVSGWTFYNSKKLDVCFSSLNGYQRPSGYKQIGVDDALPSAKWIERLLNIFPDGKVLPALDTKIDAAFSPLIDHETNCIIEFLLWKGEICFRVNQERFNSSKALQKKIRILIMSLISLDEQPKPKVSISDLSLNQITGFNQKIRKRFYTSLAQTMKEMERDERLNILEWNQGRIYFEIITKGVKYPDCITRLIAFGNTNEIHNHKNSVLPFHKKTWNNFCVRLTGRGVAA